MIAELRELGHDLWSFDADDGFQIWCSFRKGTPVTVAWPDHRAISRLFWSAEATPPLYVPGRSEKRLGAARNAEVAAQEA
jgi:hypothetical protein